MNSEFHLQFRGSCIDPSKYILLKTIYLFIYCLNEQMTNIVFGTTVAPIQ